MQFDGMEKLVAAFQRLPGVGKKTAVRYAYTMLEMKESEVERFIEALNYAKTNIRLCAECGDYTDKEICDICATRDKKTICVVAQPKDVLAFEKLGTYKGVYHVLHGTLDFQKGIGAGDIRIKELAARLAGAEEVIIATNPDISGELTASYVANMVKQLGIKVTRLAYGISIGSEIEYADELTLQRALSDRKPI